MNKLFESYHVDRFDIGRPEDMAKLSKIVVDPKCRIESKQILKGEAGYNQETSEMISSPDVVILSYFRKIDW